MITGSNEDRLARNNDARLGKAFRLLFQKDGAPDPARPNIEIIGIRQRQPAKTKNADHAQAKSWKANFSAGQSVLHITRSTYDGPPIRQLDKVIALDVPGQPVFEVSSVDDRDLIRLIVELNEAS